MRRLSGTEKGVAGLAVSLVVGGGWAALCPSEGVIVHPRVGGKAPLAPWVEYVSENRARFYGGMGVLLGAGLGWLVLRRAD